MLHPTINELQQDGKFNRYEVAIATAKCARMITEEYVQQRELAEREIAINKDGDHSMANMIDSDLRDQKAVSVAVDKISKGDFEIHHDPDADGEINKERTIDISTLIPETLSEPIVIQDDEEPEEEKQYHFDVLDDEDE